VPAGARGRAVGIAVGTVLLTIALTYAFRPFTKTSAWFGYSPLSVKDDATAFLVVGECRPPVLSAPGRDDDELDFWTVTVGTDDTGIVPVPEDQPKDLLNSGSFLRTGRVDLPDRLCATRARERLATSAIFLTGASLVLVFSLRRIRHAPAPH
jgi:hypothetical protein